MILNLITHPCVPTLMIWHVIRPCDIDDTHLISHGPLYNLRTPALNKPAEKTS